MINGNYILVKAPDNYTGKKYRGKYCYEHQLVWWENTGEITKDNEVIHHINDNKHDNRIENLQRMTVDAHNKLHGVTTMCELICPSCGRKFNKPKRNTFLILPSKITFCSRKCIGDFNYRTATQEKIDNAIKINLVRVYYS